MTCYGHSFAVKRVRYTADRSRIVSSSNKIKIWDATTGKELREIDGQQFDINLAGTQIAASTSDHKIKLVRFVNRRRIQNASEQGCEICFKPSIQQQRQTARSRCRQPDDKAVGPNQRQITSHDQLRQTTVI